MQKINTILLILLLLAVGYLLIDRFSNPSENADEAIEVVEEVSTEVADQRPGVGQIAFVDLDSLNAHFDFLKDKLDLMQSEQSRQQKSFERQAKKVEERYMSLQEDAYKMTQDQLVAAETEMQQAQVQLQSSQERITKELIALETSIQKELNERIDAELEKFNEIHGYDYILAKSAGGGVLTTKDQFDVTQPILEALNATYAADNSEE